MNKENKQEEDSSSGGAKAALAGAVAALAAGAIYFYGPDGERRRRKLHGWMLKAKGEVLDRLEELEDVSEEKYQEIVETVMDEFAERKEVSRSAADTLRAELKEEWRHIRARALEKGEELRKVAAERLAEKDEED